MHRTPGFAVSKDARRPDEPFSFLGGPLHRTGRWLGLVRGTNTVRLGLALGVGVWLIVFALALVEGVTDRLFTLSVVGVHARFLVVIPLFFICESWVAPRMTAFVTTIIETGVVPSGAKPALDAEVTRTNRRADAWWPEAVCLLAAVALEVTGSGLQKYGETGVRDPSHTALAALAYFRIGLTLFRFLLFRWAWKLALWCWFLWRVSRTELWLIPGHPDRAGGLGSIEGVHERFTPLVAALSVLECASLAESISTSRLAITAVYPWLARVLVVDAALFLGPLLVFTDKLWESRTMGVAKYMTLASRYVTEFETKWTNGRAAPGEPLIGSPDIQSLADLATAVNGVKNMRWIPAGPRILTMMTLAATLPLAPLVLFQYPVAELAQKFLLRLVGF
jgi:hypothetical protein